MVNHTRQQQKKKKKEEEKATPRVVPGNDGVATTPPRSDRDWAQTGNEATAAADGVRAGPTRLGRGARLGVVCSRPLTVIRERRDVRAVERDGGDLLLVEGFPCCEES
ncbi:hypothetical protein VTO42DRAFT_3818 [Malbranchea cinnamomea]